MPGFSATGAFGSTQRSLATTQPSGSLQPPPQHTFTPISATTASATDSQDFVIGRTALLTTRLKSPSSARSSQPSSVRVAWAPTLPPPTVAPHPLSTSSNVSRFSQSGPIRLLPSVAQAANRGPAASSSSASAANTNAAAAPEARPWTARDSVLVAPSSEARQRRYGSATLSRLDGHKVRDLAQSHALRTATSRAAVVDSAAAAGLYAPAPATRLDAPAAGD